MSPIAERIVVEPRALQSGWRWAALSDLGPLTDGDWILNQHYAESGIRLLQVGDVGLGEFRDRSSRFISEQTARDLKCTLLETGDILISRMPDPLGRACRLPNLGYPCITAVDVSIWRPDEARADPDFLTYYLASSEWLSLAASKASGATRPRISRKVLETLLVPLPPLPEQKRIAASQAAEDADALWKRAVDISLSAASLGRYPTRLLIDACRRKGQYGTSMKSNREGIGPPVLGMPNIGAGRLSWSPISHVDLDCAEVEKYRLNDGDLLFNRTNSAELVGKTAVFREQCEAVFASYLIRFVVDPSVVIPEYVCYLVNSGIGRRFIEGNMARAIGQVNISASAMHRFPIPLPPLDVQATLVSGLDSCRRLAETVADTAAAQAAESGKLSAAILRTAFSADFVRSD